MTILRWGICSAGLISEDFCSAICDLENHKIQAVAARNIKNAKSFAEIFGVETAHEGYQSLAHDPNVDIVYIGTINSAHFPLCKLFLEAKKHVLCEKPLGLTSKEVSQMIDLARRSGVFFMEGIWSRFFPSMDKVRSLISSGEIGEVKFLSADFCVNIKEKERISDKSIGGGAIYDIGIYAVQLATMILGPDPVLVQGVGGLTDTGVDECCSMTLQYAGNKVANLMVSIAAFGNCEASIVGTEGRINLTGCFHNATRVSLVRGFPGPGLCTQEVFKFPLPPCNRTVNYLGSEGLRYEAEAVKQAIDEGKTEHPLVPWSESLAIHNIMDKLRHDVGYYQPGEEQK